jgi:DNA-binding MarR family transcriptional regulator
MRAHAFVSPADDVKQDGAPEVWRVFVNSHAAVFRRLEEEMEREAGFSLGWSDVLVHLGRAKDGRLRLQDLIDSLLLSQSGVSRLVDRMEAAGLVSKETSTSDRRAVHVALTSAGGAALRRASRVHLRGIEEHFTRHLTADEAAVVAGVLRKVRQASVA